MIFRLKIKYSHKRQQTDTHTHTPFTVTQSAQNYEDNTRTQSQWVYVERAQIEIFSLAHHAFAHSFSHFASASRRVWLRSAYGFVIGNNLNTISFNRKLKFFFRLYFHPRFFFLFLPRLLSTSCSRLIGTDEEMPLMIKNVALKFS